jgi:hypothetical protein
MMVGTDKLTRSTAITVIRFSTKPHVPSRSILYPDVPKIPSRRAPVRTPERAWSGTLRRLNTKFLHLCWISLGGVSNNRSAHVPTNPLEKASEASFPELR